MATPTEQLVDRERLLGRLLGQIEEELPGAVELRHRLHRNPELAHEERGTLEMVAAELPVPYRPVAGTGGAAVVGAGSDDAGGAAPVAVRAELDGLPLRERTGSEFSATGETMHACGHDVHMAALVALAVPPTGSGTSSRFRCWRCFSRARRPTPPEPNSWRGESSPASRPGRVGGPRPPGALVGVGRSRRGRRQRLL